MGGEARAEAAADALTARRPRLPFALQPKRDGGGYPDPGGPRFARAAAGPGPAGRPGPLHVASFNIQLGARLDAVRRVVAAERALHDADLLGVQEADEHAVERLADDLGAGYVYYPSTRHPGSGRNFGTALLSRWPLADDAKLPLPNPPGARALLRAAVGATVKVRGRALRCWNVHLSTLWEMGPAAQDRQIGALATLLAAEPGPVLVLGDFNRRGAARALARAGYAWHTDRIGATHLVWSFDHVLSRGLEPGPVEAGAVASALAASDHKAVWCRLG